MARSWPAPPRSYSSGAGERRRSRRSDRRVLRGQPGGAAGAGPAVRDQRAGAFPAWLGWLSLAAAAAQLAPALGIVLDGGPLAADGWLALYAPYPLYVVWLAAATIAMVRRIGKPAPGRTMLVPDTPEELVEWMRRRGN